MTQEEIKAEYQRLSRALAAARQQVEVAQAQLRVNQAWCSHPDRFQTSTMGELGSKCPDCGHQT